MSLAELTTLAESALALSIVLSLPVVGIAAIVGLLVAALQAMTQLQDSTIAHLPRLIAVAVVLAVTGPWMGSELAAFALDAFTVR